jgi:IclR family transcriptional regulator, acetate operon repressor
MTVEASSPSTVQRVFAVLEALADQSPERRGMPVSEIARAVGRERSQISRMLKQLAALGVVEQDPVTRSYRLGWQMYALAARSGDHRLLVLARPVLADLATRSREVALLSVLRGGEVLTVLRQDSPRLVQAGGWVGLSSPLHVTAAGRILLSEFSDRQIGDLVRAELGRGEFGARAPATVEEVLDRCHSERRQGLAVAVDELEDGFSSVAAPVRDADGVIIATVNISGPTSRVSGRLPSVARYIREAAEHLTQALRREAAERTGLHGSAEQEGH